MKLTAVIIDRASLEDGARSAIEAGDAAASVEAVIAGSFQAYQLDAEDADEVYRRLALKPPPDYKLGPMRAGDLVVGRDILLATESGWRKAGPATAKRIRARLAQAPAPSPPKAKPESKPRPSVAASPKPAPVVKQDRETKALESLADGESKLVRGLFILRRGDGWMVGRPGEQMDGPLGLADAAKAMKAKLK